MSPCTKMCVKSLIYCIGSIQLVLREANRLIISPPVRKSTITTARAITVSHKITGALKSENNCYGINKLRFLKKEYNNLNDYYIYAYGDSKSDKHILNIADEPFYRRFE